MSSLPLPRGGSKRTGNRLRERLGDSLLIGLCALASLIVVGALVAIVYQVIAGARPSIGQFGFGFITHSGWKPNFNEFGAATFLYGTAVSSLIALVLGAPIGIAIGLFLSLMAPNRVTRIVAPLVEMLAAIPSVILGFWGILIFCPWILHNAEPPLSNALGFIPLFGTPSTSGSGMLAAGLILTIMVIPIIASISRTLFDTVPRDLRDGASALGSTEWEVIRGVVLPSTASGLAATTFLGLGRALGEAIAVTQVIGSGTEIKGDLFATGDTLASRIASQFQSATSDLQIASLFYLALLLLAIGLAANLIAQWIGRRFDVSRAHAK